MIHRLNQIRRKDVIKAGVYIFSPAFPNIVNKVSYCHESIWQIFFAKISCCNNLDIFILFNYKEIFIAADYI